MIKKEGLGWRIIRDSSRGNFSTLIGGETWAIELNKSEWENLVEVIMDLSDQYKSITTLTRFAHSDLFNSIAQVSPPISVEKFSLDKSLIILQPGPSFLIT